MNNLTQLMNDFNFSKYETTCYVTLLRIGPSTGYEISKESGIPRSKIYGILKQLENKSVILSTKSEQKLYSAISSDELIASLYTKNEHKLQEISQELKQFNKPALDDNLWTIKNYDLVLQKALELVEEATEKLYLQIWKEDMTPELIDALKVASNKIDEFVLILFSEKKDYHLPFDRFYIHSFETDKLKDYGARWINIVSDEQVLYGKVEKENDVTFTKNESFVFLSEEYIIHDAYNLRTIEKLKPQAQKVFGNDLEKIRDIYMKDSEE